MLTLLSTYVSRTGHYRVLTTTDFTCKLNHVKDEIQISEDSVNEIIRVDNQENVF